MTCRFSSLPWVTCRRRSQGVDQMAETLKAGDASSPTCRPEDVTWEGRKDVDGSMVSERWFQMLNTYALSICFSGGFIH